MNRRFRCSACRTAFVASDEVAGPSVACPKCGAVQARAGTPASAVAPVVEATVFVPKENDTPGRRRRWLTPVLALLTIATVATIVAWPTIKRWWHPIPPDPIETVAESYLKALVDGDNEASSRLGTIDLPPALRTYRAVHHDKTLDYRLKGSFAPLTAFHTKLAEQYDYDPAIGRFTPKNALGPAAETLDALEQAKAKAEKEGLYTKMASGNPDDLFDAAEGLAKAMSTPLLAAGLTSKKLVPTYKQLVGEAKPPLPAEARELALDFGANRETWDQLLKRSYVTLKADGPFQLDRAEVTASVIDSLGSLGDPPVTLHLTLTRFRFEGIDTRWRVTASRREGVSSGTTAVPSQSLKTQ